jgi:hypothetical protein
MKPPRPPRKGRLPEDARRLHAFRTALRGRGIAENAASRRADAPPEAFKLNLLERIEDFVDGLSQNLPRDFAALTARYRESTELMADLITQLALQPGAADLLLERHRLTTLREEIKTGLIETLCLPLAGEAQPLPSLATGEIRMLGARPKPAPAPAAKEASGNEKIASEKLGKAGEVAPFSRFAVPAPSQEERDALIIEWASELAARGKALLEAGEPASISNERAARMRPWVEDCLLLSAVEYDSEERRAPVRDALSAYWEWKKVWAQAKGNECLPVLFAWMDALADRLELASSPMANWLVLLEACSFERAAQAYRGERHQPLFDALVRLDWMERGAPWDDILDRCRLLRHELIVRRLDLFARRVETPGGIDKARSNLLTLRAGQDQEAAMTASRERVIRAHWDWYDAGIILQAEGRQVMENLTTGPRPLNGAHQKRLWKSILEQDASMDRLRDKLRGEVQHISDLELENWRRDFVERADDVFSQVSSRDLDWSRATLRDLRDDANWITQEYERRLRESPPADDPKDPRYQEAAKAPIDVPPSPEKLELTRQRLEKIRREATDEHRELILQSRLERVLTRAGANALDLTVNILIIFVLSLLVIFTFFIHFDPFSPWGLFWEEVDALVCCVLLFEFFLKLTLSESSWWYFKKRWFTDLLPSIPFGYIAVAYLHAFHEAAAVTQGLRAVRLTRLLRVVRAVRFVRYLRLISFMQRIIDRLTRKFRGLIDVNVRVFGEGDRAKDADNPGELLRSGVAHIRAASMEGTARSLRSETRARWLFWIPQMASLEARVKELANEEILAQESPPGAGVRDMRLEEVIDILKELEDADVEGALGGAGTRQVAGYAMFLGPLLFPLLGIHGARRLAPAALLALLGRRLAAALDWTHNGVINGFRDLYGIVTPAELFSFAGGFLSRSFKRHKNRLVFGLGILAAGYVLVKTAEGHNHWLLAGEAKLARAVSPELVEKSIRQLAQQDAERQQQAEDDPSVAPGLAPLPEEFLENLTVADASQPATHLFFVRATALIQDLEAEDEIKEEILNGLTEAVRAENPLPPAPVPMMDLRERNVNEATGELESSLWRLHANVSFAEARDKDQLLASMRARLDGARRLDLSKLAETLEVFDHSTSAVIALRLETLAPYSRYSEPSDARNLFAAHLNRAFPEGTLVEPIVLDVALRQAPVASAGKALQKSFGAVLIILGVIGFLAVAAGDWLVNRAGALVEEHTRVAEAQFINLMEDVKKLNVERDLRLLSERVLRPELNVSEVIRQNADGRLLGLMRENLLSSYGLRNSVMRLAAASEPVAEDAETVALRTRFRLLIDRTILLYRDYLDGAILHYSDIKTTEQMLGNIAVREAIERVSYSPADRRRLERLDMGRSRSVFGPYLWLYFITNSISQKVGAKVIEYNHRYNTNDFDALHFLTKDPARENALAEVVGQEAIDRLREDRRDIIRSVFGTYPLPEMSLNVFRLYRSRYEGGVRIFRVPVDAMLLLGKGLWIGARRFARMTADFINPENAAPAPSSYAGREVARRKIHRMRKPVFLAALDLRARLDLAYLDLNIPGCNFVGSEGLNHTEDMDLIEASPAFREVILERRQLYADRIERFKRLLSKLDIPRETRRDQTNRRVWFTCACINESDVLTLLEADKNLERLFNHIRARRGWPEGIGFVGAVNYSLVRLARRVLGYRWLKPSEKRLFDFLAARGQDKNPPVRRAWLIRAYLLDFMGFRKIVDALVRQNASANPTKRGTELLLEFSKGARRFQNQLIAVRAVQTLASLDVLNYEQIIDDVGEYEKDELAAQAAAAAAALGEFEDDRANESGFSSTSSAEMKSQLPPAPAASVVQAIKEESSASPDDKSEPENGASSPAAPSVEDETERSSPS